MFQHFALSSYALTCARLKLFLPAVCRGRLWDEVGLATMHLQARSVVLTVITVITVIIVTMV